jgi:hypothetical protein
MPVELNYEIKYKFLENNVLDNLREIKFSKLLRFRIQNKWKVSKIFPKDALADE